MPKNKMEIIPSLPEAIGFYRGWAMARGMDQKLQTNIEKIVEHALQSDGDHRNVLLHNKINLMQSAIDEKDNTIHKLREEMCDLKNEKTWLPEDTDIKQRCEVCGKLMMDSKRSTRRTCGNNCRQKLHRQKQKGEQR